MTASWTDLTRVDVDSLLKNRLEYKGLESDCIRLIEILPSEDRRNGCEVIELKMTKCKLSPQCTPKYCALSYAWHHEETPIKPPLGMKSMFELGRQNQEDVEWKARVSPEVESIEDVSGGHMPAFWRAPNIVYCDGKFLPVSRTLYFALLRLRSLERTTKYWIDAICVKQQDEKERVSQMIFMGDIFSRAEKVIIWLGRARFPCRRFAEYLQDLPEVQRKDESEPEPRGNTARIFNEDHFEQAKSYGSNPSAPTGLEVGTYIFLLSEREHYRLKMYEEQKQQLNMFIFRPPNLGTHTLSSVSDEFTHFFREQWFHRTWTLQEMVLAEHLEFLWGPIHLTEEEMLRSVLWYNTNIVTRGSGSPTDMIFAFEARSQYRRLGPLGLLGALNLSRHRDCTMAEDKVFAVLGMAGQAIDLDIGTLAQRESHATKKAYVDYVFKHMATYLALKVGPEFLTMVSSKQTSALPSWVPDLRVDLWPSIWQTHKGRFKAIIPNDCGPHAFQVEGDILKINGARLDTISKTLGVLDEDGGSFYLSWNVRDLIDRLMPLVRYSRTSEPILRAVWRTLLLGSSKHEQTGIGFIAWFFGHYKSWTSLACGRTEPFEKFEDRSFYRHYTALELEPQYFEWLQKFIKECDSEHEPLIQQYEALHVKKWFQKKQFHDPSPCTKYASKSSKATPDDKFMLERLLTKRQKLWYWKNDKLRGLSELPQRTSRKWTEFKNILKSESELRQQEMHTSGQFATPQMAFNLLLRSCMRGRRPFVTSSGLIGLGPENLKVGDVVFSIPGALVPFLFRKSDDGEVWSLVGEAYVHGFMEGEDVSDLNLKFERMEIV